MKISMPPVKQCAVEKCAYNSQHACHALAITVGDPGGPPACDTFFTSSRQGGVKDATAGVGACKTETCKFNTDFECSASSVSIGLHHNEPDCLTFQKR